VNVTLDVFSALIDSRTGGSRVFDQIARRQRWALRGQALYRAWDREHKRLQRECVRWEPFAALGRPVRNNGTRSIGSRGRSAAAEGDRG